MAANTSTPDSMLHHLRQVAFGMISGLTRTTAVELLQRIGTVDNYFDMSASQLQAASGLHSRLLADNYRRELLERARVEQVFADTHHVRCRLCTADNYPTRLSVCDDAPALLYTLGNDCLERPYSIAIVGTRRATSYGLDFTRRLVSNIAEAVGADNLLVVSGLAYGIDIEAHRAAMSTGAATAAVLAHGLNTIYPSTHRSDAAKIASGAGMLVTEYSSATTPRRGNFLARNRIIASLADVTVVIESDYRGGAMVTARCARAYDREVMAVPGRVSDSASRGCNHLIATQVAQLLQNADDLIDLMGWQRVATQASAPTLFRALTPEQQAVIDHIKAHPDHTVNEMCRALDIPYGRLASLLLQMTIDDMLVQLPGSRYAVIDER